MTEKKTTKAKEPETSVERRKINRGSTRRIMRAGEAFEEACKAFCAEMRLQVCVVDDKGKEVAEAPIVSEVEAFARKIGDQINELTTK